uniref:Fibrinogen C-terminal domain-containing protein n=1 Tax=Amphimedon queenslandica TaxID=400682 RepID=A0A1X7V866_AMPQE
MEKTKEVYEVNELQEYDEDKGYEPFVNNIVNSSMQKPFLPLPAKIGLACIILVGFLILLAILVLQIIAVTKPSDAQPPVCTCSCPSVGATSGTTGPAPNCSIVPNDWSDVVQSDINIVKKVLQTQVSKLVNASDDAAGKIDDIRSFAEIQTDKCMNNTMDVGKILETTGNSAQKLVNIVNTLSNLQDTGTSTAGVADSILLVAQELLELHNDSSALPTSCKQIKEQQPNSPSGVYILAATDGTSTYNTYCNMGQLCGSGGGWTRLAYLDMSDSTQSCPSGFRLYQSGSVRACGRPVSSVGSCVSVQYPSNGLRYSQICGQVLGYQFGSTNAIGVSTTNINSYYVDGVSITRGSPRQHVWTLMAGLYESHPDVIHNCPCGGATKAIPSFIGTNYFCESGNPTTGWSSSLYLSDPLWDGQGCGSLEGNCCGVAGLPWFHRDYATQSFNDYLEMRVCGDQDTYNEDNPVAFYEIYVK